jgi:acyl-CoA thioesterase
VESGYEFDLEGRVERSADELYNATITDRWGALGKRANGGFLLALCVAALREEVPLPDPLVLSAFFLRPVLAGPAQISTELVRAGRRVATGEAHMSQDGREVVRTVASFTDFAKASGRTLVSGTMPDLPPPRDCVDPLASTPRGPIGIGARVEVRMPTTPGWITGAPTGDTTMTMWMRWRDGRPTDLWSLPVFVDAAVPAVLELGEMASSTVELTAHLRAHPAPGWVACRASTRFLMDGYHEEDFEIWDSTGVLVAQSRQLALLL